MPESSTPPSTANAIATSAPSALSLDSLRRRLNLLRWLVPAALLAFVIANELGLARWVHLNLGDAASTTLNILLYGCIGPLLAYLLLTFIGRWLEERETSDLQSRALRQARAQMQRSHDLTDDALQTLFATSIVLDNLTGRMPEITPETAAHFQEARQAVSHAIEQLYATQKQNKS
jgi:cytochrome b